jgi:hypothetical protein
MLGFPPEGFDVIADWHEVQQHLERCPGAVGLDETVLAEVLPHPLNGQHSDREVGFTKGKSAAGRLSQFNGSDVVAKARERRGEQSLKQTIVGNRPATRQPRQALGIDQHAGNTQRLRAGSSKEPGGEEVDTNLPGGRGSPPSPTIRAVE